MNPLFKNKNQKQIELLAPVGDPEKLEIAIHYGADAVYLAGKSFSLRNFSGNFDIPELFQAIGYAHARHVKVYVACNSFIRNSDVDHVTEFLLTIAQAKPDGIIIADPGVIHLAKLHIPEIPIHLSTQANTTNLQSALFWNNLGVQRINVARELPLEDMKQIHDKTGMEVEAFGHGAMCISYSGRCLLSSYMANRDSNQGMCAHPCRWKYAVLEEKRPDHYMPIFEDDQGTYIFSSRDLCMIDHIPEMINANICSFKIEGRMKGIHYLATVVKVYREAIDAYYADPNAYSVKEEWRDELSLINHRGYSTGFYFGDPNQILPNYEKSHSFDNHLFVGKVLEKKDPYHLIDVRNKMQTGDPLQILSPTKTLLRDTIIKMENLDGSPIDVVQPGQKALIKFNNEYVQNDIIRKINL